MVIPKRQNDFLYCEAIIKKHSKSFYYAFSQLPTEKANAVYAIYAFCRFADDCVDENETRQEKTQALQQLRHNLEAFDRGEVPDEPLWRALDIVFQQYEMDIKPFYDQLTGQSMDVDFVIPETMKELDEYCYHVGGSVGLMLLPIIATSSNHLLHAQAIELGIAMQITNILRDIGEDYEEKRRIYLPLSELQKYHYTPEDLNKRLINTAFVQLWERLAVYAEGLYDRFMNDITYFDTDSQTPVSLSARVYRSILDAVRDNNYDCLSQRNYVDKKKMTKISEAKSNLS